MTIRFGAVLPALAVLAAMGACDGASEPRPRPATVEIVSGDDQFTLTQDPLPEPLVVRVLDADGEPVPNATVVWTTNQGIVQASQADTDADGLSSAAWTLTPPGTAVETYGERTASASVGDLTPATFTGSILHGPQLDAASFTPESGNLSAGPVAVDVSAEVSTMYLGIGRVRARFYRNGTNESVYAELALTSGDAFSGVWTGSVEIPQNSPPGEWLLELYVPTVGEDCTCDGYPRAWFVVTTASLLLTVD